MPRFEPFGPFKIPVNNRVLLIRGERKHYGKKLRINGTDCLMLLSVMYLLFKLEVVLGLGMLAKRRNQVFAVKH